MVGRLAFLIAIVLLSFSACGPQCVVQTTDSSRSAANPKKPAQTLKPSSLQQASPKVFNAGYDGFSFTNYTNEHKPQNLDAETMERLCGRDICERRVNNVCSLSGTARVFMDKVNDNMDGGHCEGMSVLAFLLFSGQKSLKDFDAKAGKTFDLGYANKALQREIAYYYATQMTEPAISSTIYSSPREELEVLKRGEDKYVVGVYNPGLKDGHALSFLRAIDDDATWSRIEVYDSNYAGQLQYIRINKKANTWSYPGYEIGTAASKTLTLHPLAKRVVNQTCLMKGNDDDSRAHASNWFVWMSGPGRLVAPQTAKSIWLRDVGAFGQGPMYEVASKNDVDFLIEGEKSKSHSHSNVVVLRSGMSMALEGLDLSPGEIDKLKIGKDGDSFTYSTEDPEQVVFRLGVSYRGDDFDIKIAPIASNAGFDFNVRNVIDSKSSHHALSVRLRDAKGRLLGYTVELTRIGAKSDEIFTHKHQLVIAPHETDYLQYGKWLKNHQPLEVDKDMGSNGKLQPEMIEDEE